MNAKVDWLEDQIERMQAGQRFAAPGPMPGGAKAAQEIELLQMAAQLNGLGARSAKPNPDFVISLRRRVLAAADNQEQP